MKKKSIILILFFCFCLSIGLMFMACGKTPPVDDNDGAVDFKADFFNADNWSLLSESTGEKPVSLSDGSIKFYNANHFFDPGARTDGRFSFMLKALNDWEIRFHASASGGAGDYFTLKKLSGNIYLQASTGSSALLVMTEGGGYQSGAWVRFDIDVSGDGNQAAIEIFVNKAKVSFTKTSSDENLTVEDSRFIFNMPSSFAPGNYFIIKVWDNNAVNYLQLKPVSKRNLQDTVKVACVGDSITEGGGTKTYPLQLQEELSGDYNVVNFGLSGTTLLKNADKPYWNWYVFSAAKLFVPDIVVIMLGTNDSKTYQTMLTQTAFETDLKALIEVFTGLNPSVRIIINTCPKAHSGAYSISDANIKNKIIPAQKGIASDLSLDLLDVYKYTENKSQLFRDGIHLYDKGNEYISKLAYYTILQMNIPEGFEDLY